jgi:hypothetical protein
MKELKIIFFLGILAMIFVGCLLYPNKNQIVQAEAIVALVFVTIFYAIKTDRLVEEGQKKRMADFMEKRINDFYIPCIEKMLSLVDPFKMLDATSDRDYQSKVAVKMHELLGLYNSKIYMLSDETSLKIAEWLMVNYQKDFIRLSDKDKDAINKLKNEIASILDMLEKEKDEIADQIKKIYGYT